MRAIFRGLMTGALLSCLRAPLGIDLLQSPALAGRVAYGWRAAALAAVALGLFAAREGALSAPLFFGAFFGFAIHALLLANQWSPSTTIWLAATAAAGFIFIAAQGDGDSRSRSTSASPKLLEMLGLAVAGGGAALSIEAIARHVRNFEGGLARDDAVTACVAFLLLALGALVLGGVARARPARLLGMPIGLAAAAAACLFAERVAKHLNDPNALGAFLRRLGLEPASHGTLAFDAAIAGALLAAPVLLAGGALTAAGGRNRLFSVFVGAAVALAFLPALLELPPGATATDAQSSVSGLVPIGSLLASGGALVAILSISDRGAVARWLGIAASAAAGLPALLVKVDPLHVLSPWMPHPVFPLYVTDAPEGLVTVESFGLLGGSWAFATVDRRRVTPEIEGAVADALRLRASIELVPAELRAKKKLSVLLVGQLSPERARVLADGGAGKVDRTAGWSACMANVEDTLWGSLTEERPKPEGEILAIAEARSRIARGDYDLVVAPAVPGDPPIVRPSGAPVSTVVVRWIDLDEPLAHEDVGERVAWILDGLERPALAAIENTSGATDGRYAPLVVAAGSAVRASPPIFLLFTPDVARASNEAISARLADAARGGPHADVMAGFAAYFAAEKGRVPVACLERFQAAALAGPPDPTLRRTWDTLASVLGAQRATAKIDTFVRPIAEKHRPWDALDKALACADLEAKKPDEALRRLDPLRISSPNDFDLWTLLGEAHCASGDGGRAIESWRHALTVANVDRNRRRPVAMILAGCRDPEARAAATQFYGEFPDDAELKAKLEQDAAGLPLAPCPE